MLGVIFGALAVGALLGVVGWRTAHGATRLLALAWLGYAGYEWLIHARVLCSGECNIRVDLLLIWPALAISTLIVLLRWCYRRLRRTA